MIAAAPIASLMTHCHSPSLQTYVYDKEGQTA